MDTWQEKGGDVNANMNMNAAQSQHCCSSVRYVGDTSYMSYMLEEIFEA